MTRSHTRAIEENQKARAARTIKPTTTHQTTSSAPPVKRKTQPDSKAAPTRNTKSPIKNATLVTSVREPKPRDDDSEGATSCTSKAQTTNIVPTTPVGKPSGRVDDSKVGSRHVQTGATAPTISSQAKNNTPTPTKTFKPVKFNTEVSSPDTPKTKSVRKQIVDALDQITSHINTPKIKSVRKNSVDALNQNTSPTSATASRPTAIPVLKKSVTFADDDADKENGSRKVAAPKYLYSPAKRGPFSPIKGGGLSPVATKVTGTNVLDTPAKRGPSSPIKAGEQSPVATKVSGTKILDTPAKRGPVSPIKGAIHPPIIFEDGYSNKTNTAKKVTTSNLLNGPAKRGPVSPIKVSAIFDDGDADKENVVPEVAATHFKDASAELAPISPIKMAVYATPSLQKAQAGSLGQRPLSIMARLELARSALECLVESSVSNSPQTPYFLHPENLVQKTCPPKHDRKFLFPGEQVEEEMSEGMKGRLMLVRR